MPFKPTDKNPEIDRFLTSITGRDRPESIRNSVCATCGAEVEEGSFRDALSVKEYTISGMCQECQDKVFDT